MYKPFCEALSFTQQNLQRFKTLSERPDTSIIVCPSLTALYPIAQMLQTTNVKISAQTCSSHDQGAYTGQVSALSLKQAGAQYCLIGHSEIRIFNKTSNEDIAQQAQHLLDQKITPIICIGESREAYENKQTNVYLKAQLDPIFDVIIQANTPYVIAYEPIWSIGTGTVAKNSYLKNIFAWIDTYIKKNTPNTPRKLIYGGSVNPQNITTLKQLNLVDGFLIGAASLDFQKFENIVL